MAVAIQETKRLIKQAIASQQNCRAQWSGKIRRKRVRGMLERKLKHRFYNNNDTFDRLQSAYRGRPDYGYDPYRTWQRGTERVDRLVRHLNIQSPGRQVLDVGAGEGMLGAVLAAYGHRVTLADYEDWRDERTKHLPFVEADVCCGLPLDQASFDVICSYNTFEHVTDPAAALSHLKRLLKPNGVIYLEFGPLYASAWGLHAYRTVHCPYPQFLFSADFMAEKFKQVGIHVQGRQQTAMIPLNQWRLSQFDELWRTCGLIMAHHEVGVSDRFLDVVLRFAPAFSGLGLTCADLVTDHISVTLKRGS